MKFRKTRIGELVAKCTTWNPRANGSDAFDYIDLSSVDKDAKAITVTERYSCSEAPSRARQLVEMGDVLVATVRPNLNGVALVRAEHDGMTASTGYSVLRPIPEKLDSGFLFHWVKTDVFVQQMVEVATGANYPAVSDNKVKASTLPLPPLAEQKRIAKILDAADALRAKRREALAQLDTLLQSTFFDMFGDPATNPMGWEQSPLSKLCDVGSSKRVFVNELVEEGVPFYRGTEVGSLGEGEAVTPTLFITHDHYQQLKRHSGVPRPGDLLLPSICPDGRIFIVRDDKPFYFKDGRVLWIKAGESGINSTFLRYHLKAVFFTDYSKIASGTTFAELKIFALKDLVVHVPPRDEQNRFTKFVESIEGQKARMRAHLAELDALFASLQSRAFNGEL